MQRVRLRLFDVADPDRLNPAAPAVSVSPASFSAPSGSADRRPAALEGGVRMKAVREHLPEDLFPGGAKANWWAKTVQLDLEARGLVRRSAGMKPLRWYRRK